MGVGITGLNLLSLSRPAAALVAGVRERIERRAEASVEDRDGIVQRLFVERGDDGLLQAAELRLPISACYGAAFERMYADGAHVDGNVRGLPCDERWHDVLLDTSNPNLAVPVNADVAVRPGDSVERFRLLSRHSGPSAFRGHTRPCR